MLDVPDDPVARGAKVGAALGDEIRALFDAWTAACDSSSGSSEQSSQVRALSYASRVWPVVCERAPASAREMDAIATAARVPRLLVVALNCYDELGLVAPLDGEKEEEEEEKARKQKHGHCSGAAFARGALGQNWDCPLYYRPVIVLRSPTSVTLTFPGIVGGPFCSTGSGGVSVGWFTVVPSGATREDGVPNPVLLREAELAICAGVEVGP